MHVLPRIAKPLRSKRVCLFPVLLQKGLFLRWRMQGKVEHDALSDHKMGSAAHSMRLSMRNGGLKSPSVPIEVKGILKKNDSANRSVPTW